MATKKKKPPSFNSWMASGYGSSADIAALQQQMAGYATDYDTLAQQAAAAYNPTYNANVQALQQQLEAQLAGYNNQLSGLNLTYDKQRRNLNSQYDQSLSSSLNNLTKRGIGRSSIVGTTSAAIEGARGQALSDVEAAETDAYGDIYNNMTLAQNQYAASAQRLQGDHAAQLEARINELRNTNQTAQTQLALQIAQLQQASYQQYVNCTTSTARAKKKVAPDRRRNRLLARRTKPRPRHRLPRLGQTPHTAAPDITTAPATWLPAPGFPKFIEVV